MDIPAQKTIPFARDGNKNSIPTSGTSTDENASYQMGFPPRTMADDATAVPPTGEDVNGILNELSKASIYQQAGGLYPFSGTYAQAIGGYPLGAIVRKSDGSGIWFNSVANNMTDPDGSSASGWILAIGDFLEKSGGTMTGVVNFASGQTIDGYLQTSGGTMTGAINLASGNFNGITFGDNGVLCQRNSNGVEYIYLLSSKPEQEGSVNNHSYLYLGQNGVCSIRANDSVNGASLSLNSTGRMFWNGIDSSAFCLPSGEIKTLSLGATGSSYTAPADGWVRIDKNASASGQLILFTCGGYNQSIYSSTASGRLRITCPVTRGSSFQVTYTAGGTTNSFAFIYANADEWRKSS